MVEFEEISQTKSLDVETSIEKLVSDEPIAIATSVWTNSLAR